MSDYTIEKIHENGDVDVRFPNGSWARVKTYSNMTREDFDAAVWNYKPLPDTSAPSFLSEGQRGTASPPPGSSEIVVDPVYMPEWYQNRVEAYGSVASQIEYITENGLEAWQAHVAAIKAQFPKT